MRLSWRAVGDLVVAVVLFLAPALFHMAAMINPAISIPESFGEHFFFYALNCLMFGVYLRAGLTNSRIPDWAQYAVPWFLAIQQTFRHLPLVIASDGHDIQSIAAVLGAWAILTYSVVFRSYLKGTP